MSNTPLENVVAHWAKLYEGLSVSTKDFYPSIEAALHARGIQGLKTERVHWSEGGVLSPNREYLRVIGDRHHFDICVAPFGNGVFFSSWVTVRPARHVALTLIAFVLLDTILCGLVFQLPRLWLVPLLQGLKAMWLPDAVAALLLGPVLCTVVLLGVVGILARRGHVGLELAIIAIPGLGWLYTHLFWQTTYYRLDSLKMFMTSVHTAMLEAVDAVTSAKGVRAMTEDERKPILRQLM